MLSFALTSCNLPVRDLCNLIAMLPDTLSLPPANLRFINENDALFMRIADEMVQTLQRFDFRVDSSILDIGSGYGRLALCPVLAPLARSSRHCNVAGFCADALGGRAELHRVRGFWMAPPIATMSISSILALLASLTCNSPCDYHSVQTSA
jgi:hypothetical protein